MTDGPAPLRPARSTRVHGGRQGSGRYPPQVSTGDPSGSQRTNETLQTFDRRLLPPGLLPHIQEEGEEEKVQDVSVALQDVRANGV